MWRYDLAAMTQRKLGEAEGGKERRIRYGPERPPRTVEQDRERNELSVAELLKGGEVH